MKFILLMNVKMSTVVDILTFISMINTKSERLKARKFLICRYFTFYVELSMKKRFITSGPDSNFPGGISHFSLLSGPSLNPENIYGLSCSLTLSMLGNVARCLLKIILSVVPSF